MVLIQSSANMPDYPIYPHTKLSDKVDHSFVLEVISY